MVQRHGARHHDEPAFARAVCNRSGPGSESPVGCDVHDAALGLQQVGQRGSRKVKRHVEIDCERVAPDVVAGLLRVAAQQDSGRINQTIDAAELIDSFGNEFVAVLRLFELSGPRRDVLRNVSNFLEPAFIAACGHDRPAGFGKRNRRRGTDARACTCHQHNVHGESLKVAIVAL